MFFDNKDRQMWLSALECPEIQEAWPRAKLSPWLFPGASRLPRWTFYMLMVYNAFLTNSIGPIDQF
jgi:hypothetical protein